MAMNSSCAPKASGHPPSVSDETYRAGCRVVHPGVHVQQLSPGYSHIVSTALLCETLPETCVNQT